MLDNSLSLQEDHDIIRITLSVKAASFGRKALSVLCLCSACLFVFIMTSVDLRANAGSILGVIAGAVVLIVLPCAYLLWNLYGKEHITITTKSVSHQIDLGFIVMAPKTHRFSELIVDLKRLDPSSDLSSGVIVLARLNERTGLPEEMMRSSILLPFSELVKIQDSIGRLFGRIHASIPVPPPSLN